MPRSRLTIRRLLVFVVIFAIALGLEVMRERRSAYLRLAAHYGSLFDRWEMLGFGGTLEDDGKWHFYDSWMDADNRPRVEALRDKYARAAHRPWLSVEPDPPGLPASYRPSP